MRRRIATNQEMANLQEVAALVKTHRGYVRAMTTAWQTGRADRILHYWSPEYTGLLFSQSYGRVPLDYESGSDGLHRALTFSAHPEMHWHAHDRLLLPIRPGEWAVSHRLHFYQPLPAGHETVAMLLEVWRRTQTGEFQLIREVQEERDEEYPLVRASPSLLRTHAQFIQARSQLPEAGYPPPFLHPAWEGHVRHPLGVNQLTGAAAYQAGKHRLLFRNDQQIILHYLVQRGAGQATEAALCTETWQYSGTNWQLLRSVEEWSGMRGTTEVRQHA